MISTFHLITEANIFWWRSAMLTEVRVDESAQPRSNEVQSDAEKATDPGLAEAVRSWVHRLLDRNDTNVHLVRMAHSAVVPDKLSTNIGRLV